MPVIAGFYVYDGVLSKTYRSVDGINWVSFAGNAPGGSQINDWFWEDTTATLVAFTHYDRFQTTTNFTGSVSDWTARVLPVPTGGGEAITGLAYSPTLGMWVASIVGISMSTVLTAPTNFSAWTTRTHNLGGSFGAAGVIWVASLGLFVTWGQDAARISTSPDGITWTNRTISGGSTAAYVSMTFGGGKLVAVGLAGSIAYSTNGTTWTGVTPPTTKKLNDVCWTGSKYMAMIDDTGTGTQGVYVSTDAVTWTHEPLDESMDQGNITAAWSPRLGLYMRIGRYTAPKWSTTADNGLTWTEYVNLYFNTTNMLAWVDGKPAVPTAVTPANGSVVITDVPVLGATIVDGALQRVEWTLATDSGFTTNVRTVIEPFVEHRASGPTSEVLPDASQLFQGTWYIRARALDDVDLPSNWSASNSFTVAHAPAATALAPTGGGYRLYASGGVVNFTWDFVDTSPVDVQSAFQIVVENNVTSALIQDSGKVTSAAESWNSAAMGAGLKETDIRWKIRLWDSDDVVGAYSASQLFRIGDLPVVNVTAPASAAVVTTPKPVATWTCTPPGTRARTEYRVVYTRSVGGQVDYDSGWVSSSALTHTPPVAVLSTGLAYTVQVEVRDSSLMLGSDSNAFTTTWILPGNPVVVVNVDNFDVTGVVNLLWNEANKDANFYSWNVSRRIVGSGTAGIEEIFRTFTSAALNGYPDTGAAAGVAYEYAVTQTKLLDGVEVDSVYVWWPANPISESYWLMDDVTPANSFKLYHVISDSFTEEYETETIPLIGRGRHVDLGTRWGYRGSLTAELFDQTGITARGQRLQLEAWKADKTHLTLRTPFGDLFPVIAEDISFDRMAGTGRNERGTVTIPYSEVYADV